MKQAATAGSRVLDDGFCQLNTSAAKRAYNCAIHTCACDLGHSTSALNPQARLRELKSAQHLQSTPCASTLDASKRSDGNPRRQPAAPDLEKAPPLERVVG